MFKDATDSNTKSLYFLSCLNPITMPRPVLRVICLGSFLLIAGLAGLDLPPVFAAAPIVNSSLGTAGRESNLGE